MWYNVIMFLLFTCIYLTIQSIVIITFSYCIDANLNAGIVSTIWAVSPLYGAVIDYVAFGERLSVKHLVGVFCLIACAASISMSNIVESDSETHINEKPATVGAWIPVVLAIITPALFASQAGLMKHLCGQKGFDAFKLQFLAYAIVGVGLFSVLMTKENDADFSEEFLAIGTVGSIINTLGIVLAGKSYTLGPLGPVSALQSVSTVMFSTVQAIRFMKVPKTLEFVGMAVGMLGALVLTIPEYLERFVKYITCQRR